jgi:hypothetical protein
MRKGTIAMTIANPSPEGNKAFGKLTANKMLAIIISIISMPALRTVLREKCLWYDFACNFILLFSIC